MDKNALLFAGFSAGGDCLRGSRLRSTRGSRRWNRKDSLLRVSRCISCQPHHGPPRGTLTSSKHCGFVQQFAARETLDSERFSVDQAAFTGEYQIGQDAACCGRMHDAVTTEAVR